MDDRYTRPDRPTRPLRRSTRDASPGLWQALAGERDSFTDHPPPNQLEDALGRATSSHGFASDGPVRTPQRPTLTISPSRTGSLRTVQSGRTSGADTRDSRTLPPRRSARGTSVGAVDDLEGWILPSASVRRPRVAHSREATDGSAVLPWPESPPTLWRSRPDWPQAPQTSRADWPTSRSREGAPIPAGRSRADWPAVSDVPRVPRSATIPGRSGSMWQAVPISGSLVDGEVEPRVGPMRMPGRSRADWPAVIGSSRDSWPATGQSGRTAPLVGRRDRQLATSGQWEAVPRLGGRPARPTSGSVEWVRLIAAVVGVAFAWQVIVAFARPTASAALSTTPAPLAAVSISAELIGPPSAEVASRNELVGNPFGEADDLDGDGVEDAGDGDVAAAVLPTATVVPPTRVPPTRVPPTRVPPTRVPPTVVPPTRVPPTRVPPTPVPLGVSRHMTVTAYCLRSATSSGSSPSPGTAAAGPGIPIGARFSVPGYGEVVVTDRNANYGNDELDVWFSDCAQAVRWGRQSLTVVARS